MPDTIIEGHDARITRLEEDSRELRLSLKEMANAITDLAKDTKAREADREADRETHRRIFEQLDAHRDEFTRLWHRTDEMVDKAADAEKKRLQAELDARGFALREVAKAGLYILTGLVSALLLYKLGLK